ncbi:glycerophosphodiester phosphodiesterase family protein [Hyphococcus luteus]|nr:glycerophosphodiester phosphodiesterase family protein [Marinicaulis flavus]
MRSSLVLTLLGAFASACATQADAPMETTPLNEIGALLAKEDGGMPAFFDCLRENHAVVISAHRGGPAAGYPENALETLARTASLMPALLEIDSQRSSDGVLVLMHDDTLDRTTTGEGPVAEKTFDELRALRLVDNDGEETAFQIPTLEEALDWSEGRAMLALDRKDPISYEDLIRIVEKHNAFGRVMFATYSLDDAIKVARLSPRAMIVTPVEGADDLDTLKAGGVALDHVISWTGTETPRPDLYADLAAQGVESAFATLGWWTGSWDSRIRMLEDDTLYLKVTRGAHLVATDRPLVVADVLPGFRRIGLCISRE